MSYVTTEASAWKAGESPRRAGVSSFGVGGTNAHVILEEAPRVREVETSRPWQVLVLSAKTSAALERATVNLVEHLKQHGDLKLADVAYTYQIGRKAFHHRRMLVCQRVEDAVSALEQADDRRVFTPSMFNGAACGVYVFGAGSAICQHGAGAVSG